MTSCLTREEEEETQTMPAQSMPAWKRAVSHGLVAIVFALTFHPITFAPSETTPSTPVVDPSNLPNFHQVDSYLYRGGQANWEGLKKLRELGVTTIVDLRKDEPHIKWERAFTRELNFQYINVPMGNDIPSMAKQNAALAAIAKAAENPASGKVFVHCSHGSDRTGFVCALWRVRHDNWSVAEAFAEMLKHGFIWHKLEKHPGDD